jgi:hypothetical protein
MVPEYKFNGWNYKINPDPKGQPDLFEIKSDKYPVVPTELFHYYMVDFNSVDAFINHYVYANHPLDFNDPFDCNQELISLDSTSLEDILALNNGFFDTDKIIKLYSSNDPKDKYDLHKDILGLLCDVLYMKVGIYCMTNRDNSMEMWSYYSTHRGFVVKYDLDKLPKNHWGPFPINYTNDFKKIDYSLFKNSSFIYQSNIKAQCWDHENEWRLIFYGPDVMKVPNQDTPNAHSRKFYYHPQAIKEIIIGFNFFESNELDMLKSDSLNFYVHLRKDVKLKREFLKYLLKNKYKVSMIFLKKESSSDLLSKPIEIEMISSNKYLIKYVG